MHATSINGSVNLRVPASFEGAVIMTTTWGSVKISDAIKVSACLVPLAPLNELIFY